MRLGVFASGMMLDVEQWGDRLKWWEEVAEQGSVRSKVVKRVLLSQTRRRARLNAVTDWSRVEIKTTRKEDLREPWDQDIVESPVKTVNMSRSMVVIQLLRE
jgi:hypothetical protein